MQNCPGEFPIGLFCKCLGVVNALVNYHLMVSVTGMSFRLCDYGGIWQQPNVSTCATRQFIDIKNKVIISNYHF